MATRSPHTPSSSMAHQPRRSSFAATSHSLIPSSARRPSTSGMSHPSVAGSPAISVAASPSFPASPAPTGIPAFRSLRSLLPFGPGKNATPVSATVSPSPAPPSSAPSSSRSPFAGFGSVRRSMTRERERKSSLTHEERPVLAIGRPEEPPVRRSVSLSRLEKPLPDEPTPRAFVELEEGKSNPFLGDEEDTLVLSTLSPPILRTPSPGPPLAAELSTIIEADTSGASVAKYLLAPSLPTSRSNSVSNSASNSPSLSSQQILSPEMLFARVPAKSGTHLSPLPAASPNLRPSPGSSANLSPLPASSPNLSPILPVRPTSSKTFPNNHPHSNSRPNSHPNSFPNHDPEHDTDHEELDLSTSHVAAHVLDAIAQGSSAAAVAREWRETEGAVVVDVDGDEGFRVGGEDREEGREHEDEEEGSLDLSSLDPDLQALLSPNNLHGNVSSGHANLRKTHVPPPSLSFSSPSTTTLTNGNGTSFTNGNGASFVNRSTPSLASPSTTSLASASTTRPRASLLPRRLKPISPQGISFSSVPPGSPHGDTISPSPSKASFPPPSPSKFTSFPGSQGTGFPSPTFPSPTSPASPSSSAPPGAYPQLSPSRTIIIHEGDTPPQSPVELGPPPVSAGSGSSVASGPATFSPQANSNSTLNASITFTSTPAPPRGAKRLFSPAAASTLSSRGSRQQGPGHMLGVTSPGGGRSAVLSLDVMGQGQGSQRPPSPLRPPPSPSRAQHRSSMDYSRRRTPGSASVSTGPGLGLGALFMPRSRGASVSPERISPGDTQHQDDGERDRERSAYFRPSLDTSTASARPSLDSTRPSLDSRSSMDGERPRFRARTPVAGVERASPSPSGSRLGVGTGVRVRKRSMSVQERLGLRGAGGRFGDLGLGQRPGSSLSSRGGRGEVNVAGEGRRAEWLGPRTAKAFRAAGLLDFDRTATAGELGERERERGVERERSGSVFVSPSPRPAFASMRSASEYNPRVGAGGRGAFSDAGAGESDLRRQGSGGGSAYGGGSVSAYGGAGGGSAYGGGGGAGLMESPTFTTSSGSRDRDRDTPHSGSTAPTSVSGSSFGYFGRDRVERDREREREEIKDLKDKHAIETGALLSALSDSQRTVRVLRDENAELRERLARGGDVERENEELRRVCAELRRECAELRREGMVARANARAWRGAQPITPVSRGQVGGQGMGRVNAWATPGAEVEVQEEVENEPPSFNLGVDRPVEDKHDHEVAVEDEEEEDNVILESAALSSTPAKARRRYSATSSIFPVPPANMSMLLHENAESSPFKGGIPADNGDASFSKFHSLSRGSVRGHIANKSITSNVSISPTTANFSMATGSPGSLCLRPEHEMLLGEMESLDLSVRGEGVGDGMEMREGEEDDW